MKSISPSQGEPDSKHDLSKKSWFQGILWGIALLMFAVMAFVIWSKASGQLTVYAQAPAEPLTPTLTPEPAALVEEQAALPPYEPESSVAALLRRLDTHTIIPEGSRMDVVEYTVQKGDSIFGIASEFGLKADSILWANYDVLNDDPHMMSIGIDLKIPPIDGVYYQWEKGDTLEKVAGRFHVEPDAILNWPGNDLDLADPVIEEGAFVMIPGGWREYKQWVIPTIWRENSGANKSIAGGCEVTALALGSGSFIWPADNHYLSGNDYFDGHLGVDIAAGTGAPVYAADSGAVVYAAPIGGGYGNMVMIDHGNGYHTVYAHLSSINVACGSAVGQGNVVGYAGSTGNSTGPHLHFEVRYLGGFINPWFILP